MHMLWLYIYSATVSSVISNSSSVKELRFDNMDRQGDSYIPQKTKLVRFKFCLSNTNAGLYVTDTPKNKQNGISIVLHINLLIWLKRDGAPSI